MTDEVLGGVTSSLLTKLRRSDRITEEEADSLDRAISDVESYAPRSIICRAHVDQDVSKLLVEGFVSRQCTLVDGRRQILAIHVPGDFVDLHAFVLKYLDHDVVALSPAKLAIAPHQALRKVTDEEPHLARMLWFSTAVDAAIHREWIASLGRSAMARVAHLFCELRARLEVVGLADRSGYALPLTQVDLADATSLTPVHVNRTLRQMREAGLLDFRSGRVEIGDLVGLIRIAAFDPRYLYFDRIAR
ncbi:Crp/Fnr family transcriptional regulator [Sphingomonas bacterium]|uniref:Crp/Fnr family transcriptional regulator n=1 Tax=Sphingomonas bacterium TaxID=1895847 RepID=UPI001577473E|nr:Crp/Fnr family transcriptional regulator [Sphingomonas bacterium]